MNIMTVCFLLLQLDASQPAQTDVNFIGDTWSLFIMVLKMCLTLGAVCILAFLVLRYGLPRITGMQMQQNRLMRIVARFPLEGHKSLYIVEVAGKNLLLGVTEQRIQMLSEIEADAVRKSLEAEAENQSSTLIERGSNVVKDFSKYLRR